MLVVPGTVTCWSGSCQACQFMPDFGSGEGAGLGGHTPPFRISVLVCSKSGTDPADKVVWGKHSYPKMHAHFMIALQTAQLVKHGL